MGENMPVEEVPEGELLLIQPPWSWFWVAGPFALLASLLWADSSAAAWAKIPIVAVLIVYVGLNLWMLFANRKYFAIRLWGGKPG